MEEGGFGTEGGGRRQEKKDAHLHSQMARKKMQTNTITNMSCVLDGTNHIYAT